MGLMDRDYYRDKTGSPKKEGLVEKIKRNPLAVVALLIVLLFILSILL